MVFFTDKNSSPYSIDNPSEYLSARAIQRRENQGIAITEEDLPVNLTYIEWVKASGSIDIRYTFKWINGVHVQATSADAEALKLLSFVSNVEYIAPSTASGRIMKEMDINELAESESDTLFQFDILGVSEMRADGYQGENMLIAVIDGGFRGVTTVSAFSHLFDNNQILMTYDLVKHSEDVYDVIDHGTKVLSILAARNTNPEYYGVVPNANYLLFNTEDLPTEYRTDEYRWMKAAEIADSAGADIISSSLGYNEFDDPVMNYELSDIDGQTAVTTRAVQMAANKGILVVNSAGNTGLSDPWEKVLVPGDMIDGLAVGSLLTESLPSTFSARGPTEDGRIKPDVMADGSGTFVINETGMIVNASGTSYSTPLVAGLAAGVWQAYPEVDVLTLIDAFRNSSSLSANPNSDMGYGIPSYRALVNYLENESSEQWLSVYPNPVSGHENVRIKVSDPTLNSHVKISIFDRLGRELPGGELELTWQNN
ncbi:MAG: S8 family serine peptidase, partial [Bacteroidota bacterium]